MLDPPPMTLLRTRGEFPPTFRERPVGTARIATDVSGRCVAAALVEGKARRFDEVHPASADRKPH
ncbi:hypothetical protein H9L17_00990 [Thermomonas brevis]|uniref:Uncharacterized protein n=1 Tax=Thermomonas brevis TaxID=215691 RepID=A0A7G9QTW6_9GAMM|nr:hypothetical protein [Thermomonas brevis]QNN46791.1 hypothetical protein H9L17_00990 [Thermomonas brevis]